MPDCAVADDPDASIVMLAETGLLDGCEAWLGEHFRAPDIIRQVVARSKIAERTLKRRFKAATGSTLIEYLQNLRVEEAKRQLESTALPVEEISAAVGYEDPSFFRRLFKRSTGLTPSQYRRMFQPVFRVTDSV